MVKLILGCLITIISLLAIDFMFPNQVGKVSSTITGSMKKTPVYASDISNHAQKTKLYKDIVPSKRFSK